MKSKRDVPRSQKIESMRLNEANCLPLMGHLRYKSFVRLSRHDEVLVRAADDRK